MIIEKKIARTRSESEADGDGQQRRQGQRRDAAPMAAEPQVGPMRSSAMAMP